MLEPARVCAFAVLAFLCVACGFHVTPGTRSSARAWRRTKLAVSAAPSTDSTSLHGLNNRYYPIHQLQEVEHMPRIVQIAGVYGEVTPEQFAAPQSTPAPLTGMWTYDFSDPEGPQMGTVAFPGGDAVNGCTDPVVLIGQNTEFGLFYPEDVECEILLLIDRGDTAFTPSKIYVFRTPANTLSIRGCDSVPIGHSVLGRVVLCTLPFVPSMKKRKTGFMEEDEEYI